MSTTTNTAIFKKTYRQSITFEAPPSPETVRELRKEGFEYRSGQWVKVNAEGVTTDEQAVANSLGA